MRARSHHYGHIGKLGTTVAESEAWWPTDEPHNAPNIITVIFDDTGWADFGCFGSEIATPTIDSLAAAGLRYSNFHVTPLCSPTRACLMTGRNHHAVGMRCLSDTDTGFPNGRGCIPADIPMLPAILQQGGYSCFQVGKWHLTPAHEITAAGPFGSWPLARGFDRFYGFLGGCTDQYSPELCVDNHFETPKASEGYHLSEDLCTQAVKLLRNHVSLRSGTPFFLNLAFAATHAPIQVPRNYIDPYIPVFEKGWDQTRFDRLERQKSLGVVPPDTHLTERDADVPAWNDLSAAQRLLFTHLQAAYAGFLQHADEHLARVVDELKALGLFENTIILVLSDNGASREGGANGAVDVNGPYSGKPESIADQIHRLKDIGGPRGPAHYPQGWAMAGNTPFRKYKQFVELGGVRSPLILSWPNGIENPGEVRRQFVHVVDIAPTLLDVNGEIHDFTFDGQSFANTFKARDAPNRRGPQYWEMFGRRAIYSDGWKAISSHEKGDDYSSDRWKLYDTAADFSEANDVASDHTERVEQLVKLWWAEAKRNSVLPLDDRTLLEIINFRQPNGLMSRRRLTLFPGQDHIPQYSLVTATDRSMQIVADFTEPLAKCGDGVVLASGDNNGGYSLFLKEGKIFFEHMYLHRHCLISADHIPEARSVKLVLRVSDDDCASVSILCDDLKIARGTIPLVANHLSFWGMDIGADCGRTVSRQYQGPFPLRANTLQKVELTFLEPAEAEDLAALIEATE